MLTEPAHGGQACPPLVESEACNTEDCQCQMTPFTEWGECSAACGPGVQTRTREVVGNPGNATCGVLFESRPCVVVPCPVNCVTGPFSEFSACSEACGGGTRTRSRAVLVEPAHNGTACGPLEETEPCNTEPCAVQCLVSEWSEFGACSSQCGGGHQSRTRTITRPPQNGGLECPPLVDTRQCNVHACANCTLSAWDEWSACSVPCGAGTQRRNRTVSVPPQEGGHCDAALTEERPCDAGVCPCDCLVGSWSEWTPCTEQCGAAGGTTMRFRNVTRAAIGHGAACPPLNQTRTCNAVPCDEACEVSGFGEWGACSAQCGGGVQTRTRTVTKPGSGSSPAARCPALHETRTCNTGACPAPSDCIASGWSAWSACSAPCGGGLTHRTRAITRNNSNGDACLLQTLQTQPCGTEPCSQSCETGAWTEWSECTSTCGGGIQKRTRPVAENAVNGGEACGATDEFRECNAHSCGNYTKCAIVDPPPTQCNKCCAQAPHTEWSPCRPHCDRSGQGVQTRTRQCSSCPSTCDTQHHAEERPCALAQQHAAGSTTTLVPAAAPHDYSHCGAASATGGAKIIPVDDSAAKASVKAAVAPAAQKVAASAAPHAAKLVAARIVSNVMRP